MDISVFVQCYIPKYFHIIPTEHRTDYTFKNGYAQCPTKQWYPRSKEGPQQVDLIWVEICIFSLSKLCFKSDFLRLETMVALNVNDGHNSKQWMFIINFLLLGWCCVLRMAMVIQMYAVILCCRSRDPKSCFHWYLLAALPTALLGKSVW